MKSLADVERDLEQALQGLKAMRQAYDRVFNGIRPVVEERQAAAIVQPVKRGRGRPRKHPK